MYTHILELEKLHASYVIEISTMVRIPVYIRNHIFLHCI